MKASNQQCAVPCNMPHFEQAQAGPNLKYSVNAFLAHACSQAEGLEHQSPRIISAAAAIATRSHDAETSACIRRSPNNQNTLSNLHRPYRQSTSHFFHTNRLRTFSVWGIFSKILALVRDTFQKLEASRYDHPWPCLLRINFLRASEYSPGTYKQFSGKALDGALSEVLTWPSHTSDLQ